MQIGAIQSLSSIAPTPVVQPTAAAANRSTTAVSPATTSASVSAGPSATTSSSTTASGEGTSHGSGKAQSTSNSSAAEASLAAVYSVTVGGTSYSGSVEESGGEYTASIANLPGASASGSSVQGAEDNLGSIIDTLV
jgi:hypothetical protein